MACLIRLYAAIMLEGPVGDKGELLAYIDSGSVQSDVYTTLVCVHGHIYHSQNFRRLLPLAAEHKLRIIAANRRDYVGSTPYSAEELAQLKNGNAESLTEFMKARGLEVARFLAWIIKEHKIPKASEDGLSGGLALLGWSAGNMTTLAFLRHIDSYPSNLLSTIKPYLRTFVLYDSPFTGLGFAGPKDAYHPATDLSVPEEKRGMIWNTWASSYFTHPSPSSRTIIGLQLRIPEKPSKPPTIETISPHDLLACTDTGPGKSSDLAFHGAWTRQVLYDQMRGAFFDEELASVLPEVRVRMVYCTQSIWSAQWCAWEMEKEMENCARPLKIIPVDDGNHFLHWEDPDRALTVFASAIRS